MTEHKEPIPSRIYNSALGGHVAGANDIIDDELELTQDEINKAEYAKPASTGPTGDYPNNGMGRIVLKKNKTFAEQLTQTNTIYEIRYDFDLNDPNGENPITIPENCVLQFDGGSLNNGTITGQNTGINADLVKIFSTDVTIAGSWNVEEAYPEWFGAKNDGITDSTVAINKVTSSLGRTVKLKSGTYLINGSININSSTSLKGNGMYKTNILYTGNEYAIKAFGTYTAFGYPYIKDLTVMAETKGSGIGIGLDLAQNNIIFQNVSVQKFNIGINVATNQTTEEDTRTYNVYDTTFFNCRFSDNNTGLKFNKEANAIRVNNCGFTGNKNYAIHINNSHLLVIDGCRIESNGKTNGYAIYIYKGNNNVIQNSYFENNGKSDGYHILIETDNASNLCYGNTIKNNYFNITSTKGVAYISNTMGMSILCNHVYAGSLYAYQSDGIIYNINFATNQKPIIIGNFYSFSESWTLTKIYTGSQDTNGFVFDEAYNLKKTSFSIRAATNNMSLFLRNSESSWVLNSYRQKLIFINNSTNFCTLDAETKQITGNFILETRTANDGLPTAAYIKKGRTVLYEPINKLVTFTGSKWIEGDGAKAGVARSGTFANKPASADIYKGFAYFCTDKQTAEGQTNGIMIYYKTKDTTDPNNPVDVWVDALGRVVS